ncbi:MAG TPA: DAK2 domain-containing protein, partial [Streptosporangiaceae bacterium]|nr:DAK2 domain-containing protein [Streptosporangiaceae bacterium]
MPALEFLDGAAVRRWCGVAAEALGAVRDQLNALNVFPVADADTGTNLHLTMLAAVRALDELPAAAGPNEVWHALAHGVLLGAQGNSGVIVSQFLRGLADVCAPAAPCDGIAIQQALAHAARLSYAAVGEPVEGTVLTVASAGAASAAVAGPSLLAVARAAAQGAALELARSTAKLEVLARAGVVDAGGAGLCVLLDALAAVVSGAHAVTYLI